MNYKTVLKTHNFDIISKEYALFPVFVDQYIGYDKDGFLCIVIIPKTVGKNSYTTISKNIKLEFNEKILFNHEGREEQNIVHIVTCMSKDSDLIGVFLDLCELYLKETPGSSNEISKVFNMLSDFFKVNDELSFNDIQGILCELLFIEQLYDNSNINISNSWHSQEEMKFDFSISSKVKIEVKSTSKQERLHYFSHEQLSTAMYDIFVASYLVRTGDRGENLLELIDRLICKIDFESDSLKNILNIKTKLILTNSPLDRFDISYIKNSFKIYDAKDIPKVEGGPFDGVTDIKYKSYLNDRDSIDYISFANTVSSILEGTNRERE